MIKINQRICSSSMSTIMEKIGTTRCALDASKTELFTQKKFADLIYENHSRNMDYYLARVCCKTKDANMQNIYYCYDAKSLCKYIFEMVVVGNENEIKIKNFKDPVNQTDIGEITFFKLRCASDTPMKAEYEGNHMRFIESGLFRSKVFSNEDIFEALSINFQTKKPEKLAYFKKRRMIDVMIFLGLIFIMGIILLVGFKTKFLKFHHAAGSAKPKP